MTDCIRFSVTFFISKKKFETDSGLESGCDETEDILIPRSNSKMALLPRHKEAFILKNIMNEYFPYDEKDEDDVLEVIQTFIDASQTNNKVTFIINYRSDRWIYVNVLRLLIIVAPKLKNTWELYLTQL